MKTRIRPTATPQRSLWSHRIWPLLAGAVTAVGVFAAINTLGVVAMLMVYASLSMFAVTMVWGLSLEIGIERGSVVRCGLYSALAVLALLGLCQVQPQYGLLVGIAVGLSSPAALSLLTKVRPRTKRRTDPAARPAPGVLVDKAMVDRRFDEIVSQLMASGDFPED